MAAAGIGDSFSVVGGGVGGVEHHGADMEQAGQLGKVSFVSLTDVQVVDSQFVGGCFAVPAIVLQETDTFAGIGGNTVFQKDGGWHVRIFIFVWHSFADGLWRIQAQPVPMVCQRALQTRGVGQRVGTDEPRLTVVGQAMDGGAAAYVVEYQTTLRGVLKKVGRVQGRQNQYAYEEHTEIAGCASVYGPVEQEKCKVEQSHFPDVYPYVVDGRTGQSLNSPQGIVLQADHAFYYRTPELL